MQHNFVNVEKQANWSFWEEGTGNNDVKVTNEEHLAIVKQKGIKLVRIATTKKPSTMKEIFEVTEKLLALDIKVVLDWNLPLSDYTPTLISELPFLATQLAERFKRYPSSQLALGVLREARVNFRDKKQISLYNQSLDFAIRSIRSYDKDRWIVVSNPFANGIDFFDGPTLKWTPPKVKNLIVPLHYYNPYEITHQEYDSNIKTKSPYPPTLESSNLFTFNDYKNQRLHFKKYLDWCTKHKVYPWVGETGIWSSVVNRAEFFEDMKAIEKENPELKFCHWIQSRFGWSPRGNGHNYVDNAKIEPILFP